MKRLILIVMLFLLLAPAVFAREASMTLLAVTQTADGFKPATADLSLEITPGEGHVFINTFPLTKTDTQVSFRLAKEFACDYLDYDCEKLDFFYMLTSNSPIVGGPSAGAAATTLTAILLEDLNYDETTSLTGTINSGGMIGPVAGIKEKIDAAQQVGLNKVLIPDGKRFDEFHNITSGENKTTDLVEYGASIGVEVVEVSHIADSIFEFTGEDYSYEDKDLVLDDEYTATMRDIADKFCGRSRELALVISPEIVMKNRDVFESAENLTISANKAIEEGSYYSAASYCYGANVKYNYLGLLSLEQNDSEIITLINNTDSMIKNAQVEVEDYKYETITDLQTFLIVKERLDEAEEQLSYANTYLAKSDNDDALYKIATAIERVNSARSWSEFFDDPGKKFHITEQELNKVCLNKIAEAEERLQYSNSFFSVPLSDIREELQDAADNHEKGEYELCIYKASKVKARTDLIISTIGLKRDDADGLIEKKLDIAENIIIRETERGVFPIMGYSYFEYAKSLRETDPLSALLYSEFALELSNFDIYFEAKKNFKIPYINMDFVWVFVWGAAIGFLVGISIKVKRRRRRRSRRHRR